MSVILRLLLISLTLACPLNCTGALDFSAASEDAAPKCACCHHHDGAGEESSDSERRPAPFEDCACPSCFCQGALPTDDDFELSDSPQAPFTLPPPTYSAVLLAPTFHNRLAAPASAWPTGSMMRILHQSFLL